MNSLLLPGSELRFPSIGKVLILMFLLLGALPGQVFAQDGDGEGEGLACNPHLDLSTVEFPSYLEGDTVSIHVEIGALNIDPDTDNLTIDAFHFGTDCASGELTNCTPQGNTITYVPNSVSTTCENPSGTPIVFAEPAAGVILDFVPNLPIVQSENTFCTIDFQVTIDTFVGDPGDPAFVFQAGGWPREEGLCDSGLRTSESAGLGFVVNKAAIVIEKTTNGVDADIPADGPSILVGDPVVWEYMVSNTGNLPLSNIAVVDDQGVVVTCPVDDLDPGVSTLCTAPAGVAQPGQYANIGSVSAIPLIPGLDIPAGVAVTDTDPSHYLGLYPDFTIEKSSPQYPGPLSEPGTISYSYLVANTGTMDLTGLALVDSNTASAPVCGSTTLAVGESTTCTATHEFTEEELENGGNDACGLYNVVVATVAELNDTRQDDLCIPVIGADVAVPVLSNLGLLLMASLLLLAGLMTRRIS